MALVVVMEIQMLKIIFQVYFLRQILELFDLR